MKTKLLFLLLIPFFTVGQLLAGVHSSSNYVLSHNSRVPSRYTALIPYILPSPDQNQGEWGTSSSGNASTCLQMASTGAMEMLMNMDVAPEERVSEGQTDLSERWLIAGEKMSGIKSNRTDIVKVFNHYNGGMLNKHYRFTMGDVDGMYSVKYNWYNKLPSNWRSKLVNTPKVYTKKIFGSLDDKTRWDVAVMTELTIKKVKQALIKYKGPVLILLNSEEFWHAVLIVGYDDNETIKGKCPYVKDALSYLRPDHAQKVRRKLIAQGGCRKRGVFYVRDSEYYDSDLYPEYDVMYDYDLEYEGEERPYIKPYLKRSYDWLKYLGNYAAIIYRKDINAAKFPPRQ